MPDSALPPPLPPLPKVRRISGRMWLIGGGAVLAMLLILAMNLADSMVPDASVTPWPRIKPAQKALVLSVIKIEPPEEPLLFYSGAIVDLRKEGTLLSNRALYVWYPDESGKREVTTIPISQISQVDLEDSNSVLEDSELLVTFLEGEEEMEMTVLLPNILNGHKTFHEALLSQMARHKGRSKDEKKGAKLEEGSTDN